MKCIAGGCGSPGQAGAGPHGSANTFKQIAVKGGNGNVASNLHYHSFMNVCKMRSQAAVRVVKSHTSTSEGTPVPVPLSEPDAVGGMEACELPTEANQGLGLTSVRIYHCFMRTSLVISTWGR